MLRIILVFVTLIASYALGFASCQIWHLRQMDIGECYRDKLSGPDVLDRWLKACGPSVKWFGLFPWTKIEKGK